MSLMLPSDVALSVLLPIFSSGLEALIDCNIACVSCWSYSHNVIWEAELSICICGSGCLSF